MDYDAASRSRYDNSLFELYRFETDDGLHFWAYTTERADREFLGRTYTPEVISRDEIQQSAGDSSSKRLTIRIPYNLPVAALHVPYLPPRPVKVTVFSGQRRADSLEIKQQFEGYITSFAQKGEEGEFNCSTVIDGNGQPVPWIPHTAECCWALYEDGCYADRSAFQQIVTTYSESSDGTVITSPEFDLYEDGWFKRGYAVNVHTGERRFIVDHVGTDITLVYPFINLGTHASLIAYAGCDLSRRMCIDKFDNIVHRMSFDHMPDYNVFAEGVKA